MATSAALQVVPVGAPDIEKQTVLRRKKNTELRTREHLTEGEVESLVKAARKNRHGHRDSTLILVAFRHGLRASELCALRWEQIDFEQGVMHVRRAKKGV